MKTCGGCHQQKFKSYRETYHRQVTTLGYAHTAKCFDCHGSHEIKRVSDPASTVHPNNRLETCQRCHIGATAGFATFQPHATTNDFQRYPHTWLASNFMLALLGGTLAFFWTHSALWFYREYKDRQQGKLRPHVRTDQLDLQQGPYYQRWSAWWRFAHLVFAIAIIMLVLTGMTLFYADSFWAPVVQKAFGGPLVTGVVHRVFAVVFVFVFVAHLIYVAIRIGRNWRTFNWFSSDRSSRTGTARRDRHVQVVLRPRPAAAVRSLHLLGEGPITGREILGHDHHRRERFHAVVHQFHRPIPARLGVQRREHLPR